MIILRALAPSALLLCPAMANLDFYALTHYYYDGVGGGLVGAANDQLCGCKDDSNIGCHIESRSHIIQEHCYEAGSGSSVNSVKFHPKPSAGDPEALCIESYSDTECQSLPSGRPTCPTDSPGSTVNHCTTELPLDQCANDMLVERYPKHCIESSDGPKGDYVVPMLALRVFATLEDCEAEVNANEFLVFSCHSLCSGTSLNLRDLDEKYVDAWVPAGVQAYCEGYMHKTIVYSNDRLCSGEGAINLTLERRNGVCTKEGNSYVLVDCNDETYYCKKEFNFATGLHGPCKSSPPAGASPATCHHVHSSSFLFTFGFVFAALLGLG